MKNSKNFKKILSTSLASLTALSTLSGSISTKIYAKDPEVQAKSTESESRHDVTFSYQEYNFSILFNGSNKEVAEKFRETLFTVMGENVSEYKEEIKKKTISCNTEAIPASIGYIKNICSQEKDPANQKNKIENMLNVIITNWLKETEPVANDSTAKEAQTEAPAEGTAKVEPVVNDSTAKEAQTEAPVEETTKVEPVVNDSTEETQTEAPAEETPIIEIDSSAEETKEESTTPTKEKESLLNKILNFLKKLPLIGKLFKFLFK